MDEARIAAIKQACRELADRYALYVDERLYDRFGEVFSEDAVLEAGGQRRGLADIITGMGKRSVGLVSRHVITNSVVDVLDPENATGLCYLSLYRKLDAAGPDPALLEGPALIGVYHDTYRRTPLGWRITHRSLSTTFRRPEAF